MESLLERIGRAPWAAVSVFGLVIVLPLFLNALSLDLPRVAMRPLIMRFGGARTAKILSVKTSLERFRYHNFRGFPVFETPDEYLLTVQFEPRAGWNREVEVEAGKEGPFVAGGSVPIHFLSAVSSWAVLDDDSGYARGRARYAIYIALCLVVGVVWVFFASRRIDRSASARQYFPPNDASL